MNRTVIATLVAGAAAALLCGWIPFAYFAAGSDDLIRGSLMAAFVVQGVVFAAALALLLRRNWKSKRSATFIPAIITTAIHAISLAVIIVLTMEMRGQGIVERFLPIFTRAAIWIILPTLLISLGAAVIGSVFSRPETDSRITL